MFPTPEVLTLQMYSMPKNDYMHFGDNGRAAYALIFANDANQFIRGPNGISLPRAKSLSAYAISARVL